MTTTYKIADNTTSNSIIWPDGAVSTVPYLTGSSSGTYSITSNGSNYAFTSPMAVVKQEPNSLTVQGKIIHNGLDLEERLSTIEKVLQIPERDVKLEAKHPKLKELYDAYIHALGKYRTFEAIKGDDND